MKHYISCIFLFLLFPFVLSAQDDNPYLSSIPSIPAKDVGIYIEDLRTGDVVLDVNGEKTFTPASVTKLVTTSTCLNMAKPTSNFTTEVIAQGKIKDGKLDGYIIIKVCGDPTIESRHFPANKGFAMRIANEIQRMGITEITGTAVAKYIKEYEQPTPAGWMDEDLIYPYGTEFHAANYADNVFSVSMPSGRTVPETPGVSIKKGASRRSRGSKTLQLSGGGSFANPDPESTMCRAVVNAIKDAGIKIGTVEVKAGTDTSSIYSHKSPSLNEIITSLMYRSDNLMAEGILRAIAPGKTRDEAIKKELKFWNDKGIDTHGIVIEDGSGLSRNNRITPYFLAEVLDWMRINKNNNNQYVNIFPVAGKSGTMRNFLKGTKLEGKLAAKTGSMRNVQCYAGFKLDDKGNPTHLVVIMLNNFSDRTKLKKALERLLLEKLS